MGLALDVGGTFAWVWPWMWVGPLHGCGLRVKEKEKALESSSLQVYHPLLPGCLRYFSIALIKHYDQSNSF